VSWLKCNKTNNPSDQKKSPVLGAFFFYGQSRISQQKKQKSNLKISYFSSSGMGMVFVKLSKDESELENKQLG
jgi:hypothetical protein